MTKSILKIKKSLGKIAENLSDEEVLRLENKIEIFTNLILDKILSLTPEERRILNDKIEKEENENKKE